MSNDEAGKTPENKSLKKPRGTDRQLVPPSDKGKRPKAKPGAASKQRPQSMAASEPAKSEKMRLQRALAAAGYGSRRQCEDLIVEGRVMVDGKIVHELGLAVDLGVQKVYVDGTPLKPRKLVYYALNKPVGVVTTNADPEGRPRVIDLVPPDERVFPVGRLDRSSEGLILLTNDGELAQRLAHPRYEIRKVYRVTVAGNVELETMKQMERGIYIAEGVVRVEGAKLLKSRGRATELEITLKEGKNREIRRILARLGHKVQQLKRIAIGPLRLGEMPSGAYRKLTYEEVKKLRLAVTYSHSGEGEGQDPSGPMRADRGARKPRRKSADRPLSGGRPATKRPYSGASSRTSAPRKGANRRPQRKSREEFTIDLPREVSGAVIGADPPVREARERGDKTRTTRGGAGSTKKVSRGKRADLPGKGRKLKGHIDLGRPPGPGDRPRPTKKRSGGPKRSRPS